MINQLEMIRLPCVSTHSSSADGGDSMDEDDLEGEEDIIEDMEMMEQLPNTSDFPSQGVHDD